VNLSTVEIKAFVPARDIERSKAFYAALGFEIPWSSDDLAYVRHGDASFLLQRFFVAEHARNFAMHLLVENVDDWYRHVVASGVEKTFGVRVESPEDRRWRIRDFPLQDPAGVLWRIGQNLPSSRRQSMTSTAFESISPIFGVRDLSQALAFYQGTLGFELAWSWGEPPAVAAVCRDRVEITLTERPGPQPGCPARAYLRVSGIDAYHARLERAGVTIMVPIGDRHYGLRDFRVVDPFGNELDIGQVIVSGPDA
jgi:uncharacterized glyoxalase superfamily protein PhnB